MKQLAKLTFLAIAFVCSHLAKAQQIDSTTVVNSGALVSADSIVIDSGPTSKSPKRAAFLSAVLPGAGQIYNRKYWKLPLVYAAVGGSAGLIIYNRVQFSFWKNNYLKDVDIEDGEVSEFYADNRDFYSLETIQREEIRLAEQHQAWAEYAYLAFAAAYVLQILDATVDAHLSSFDVSPDLSLNISPTLNFHANRPVQGLAFNLRF